MQRSANEQKRHVRCVWCVRGAVQRSVSRALPCVGVIRGEKVSRTEAGGDARWIRLRDI